MTRHETPRSESKDFITHSNSRSQSISIFVIDLLTSNSHRAIQRGPGDTCTYTGLHYKRKTLSLGNLNILWALDACPSLQRQTFSLLYRIASLLPWRKRFSLSSNIPEKTVWNKGKSESWLQDVQKHNRLMENCVSTINTLFLQKQ